jgi:trehalose-6-phosphatase
VYVGDDQTDEDAFAQPPAESITIRVGSTTVGTAARYWLEGPVEIQRFLEAMVEQRGCRERAAIQVSAG